MALNKKYNNIHELIEEEYRARAVRFEIHSIGRIAEDRVTDLFCSKDQMYDIDPKYLDHFLRCRHIQIAEVYMDSRRFEEARREFEQAASLKPPSFLALKGLAQAKVLLGLLREAASIYIDLVAAPWTTDAEIAEAHRELANIFKSLGDPIAAEVHERAYDAWDNS